MELTLYFILLLDKLSFVLLINVCLEMKPLNYVSVENDLLGNIDWHNYHQTWTSVSILSLNFEKTLMTLKFNSFHGVSCLA
jgi:hypothetical protein